MCTLPCYIIHKFYAYAYATNQCVTLCTIKYKYCSIYFCRISIFSYLGVVRLRPKPKIPRYCKQVDVCRRQWWWIVFGKW